MVALLLSFMAKVQGQTVDEYQMKAAFLYNFARFVEWPPQSFDTPDAPLVICVLGSNSFGRALVSAVKGKTVERRPFLILPLSDLQSNRCNILFVSSSERKRFRSMLANLRDASVLTVGETEGFTSDGGVINFKLLDGKIRFDINLDNAACAHLHISSKLLSLAQIIREPGGSK